ncbi:flagellar biosynthesis anti-sigma factor FlgM [Oceanobacillus halophilus]|uniref:Negative regulator of flagellin synthesis n=1 Tax=Oceanobacillus halophilus TaxID=930130 RepID=A0A495A6Y6_9BACI|nr:flagellar biosynthesis anti-sigma factor FlgM [Oceanobacillus halophilus]RKQ35580.1 flagellar biosynthesis anti-sigma factor FlgM [Oceanobacillus halophilus]
MKINGPHQTNFNPYKNILQKQANIKKEVNKQDQIEISNEAKQLQGNDKVSEKRAAYVQSIKNQVESGEYQVDPEKTAKKMIEFWSNKL